MLTPGKIAALILGFLLVLSYPAAGAVESEYYEKWQELAREAEPGAEEGDVVDKFRLGIVRALTGEFEEAVKWFERVEESPQNGEKEEEFARELEMGLEENPRDHLLLGQQAFLYFTAGDYEKALRNLEILIEQDPDNFWFKNYQGLIKVDLGEHEKSREIMRSSLEQEENRYTRAFLGYAYWDEGKYGRATGQFMRTGTLIFEIESLINN